MVTENDEKTRLIGLLDDAGIIVHGFDRIEKNDLGGVEIDVALTIPADNE